MKDDTQAANTPDYGRERVARFYAAAAKHEFERVVMTKAEAEQKFGLKPDFFSGAYIRTNFDCPPGMLPIS